MIEKEENMLELAKRLCIEARDLRIDEMRSIENHFWNKKDCNHRKETINHCVKNNIYFTSTANTGYDAMKDFIRIVCPKCGHAMSSSTGSGNGDTLSMQYRCPNCSSVLHLTIPTYGGITFQTKGE